jgi:HEAT repeat protein
MISDAGGIVPDADILLSGLIAAVAIALFFVGWRGLLKDIRRGILHKRLDKTERDQEAAARHARAPEILAKIEVDHDLAAIPRAFGLLFLGGDPALKLRAARSIAGLVRRAPAIRLERLDRLFRDRTSMEWDPDWRRADPAALLSPSLTEAETTVILGLASFHPSGYFREKAVGSLSLLTTGDELPYLIIRLNDWVVPIWNLADRAVRDRLTPQNARTIVDALPLIFGLRGRSRRDHHDLVRAAIGVLSTPEARPELERGLRSEDSMIRRWCYQAIADLGTHGNTALLGYLVKDPSPTNRSKVLRQLIAKLTPEEVRPLSAALLRDRSASVRSITLRLLHGFDPIAAVPDLERAISDDDPAVRNAARFHLRTHDDRYDFPALYRQELADPSAVRPGAIAGLGETGRADDTKTIAPFLSAGRARWVRAGLRAMAKLDYAGTKDTLIAHLGDPRPGVAKEARRLLLGRIDAVDAGAIHRDRFANPACPSRRHAAVLLCGLAKWDALRYILEVCADKDGRVVEVGRSALAKWLSRYNLSFITPTPDQLKANQSALNAYGFAIGEETRRTLEFILRGFLPGEEGLPIAEWPGKPGVVDLRDLAARNAGKPLEIVRFLAAASVLPDGPTRISFAPPRVVLAVAPAEDVGLLERSRAWLDDAAHVVVVRARDGSTADEDPDLGNVVLSEWQDALRGFHVPIEVVDWRRDGDVRTAVDRVVKLAGSIAPSPPSAAPPPIIEHPPGPRISVGYVPGTGSDLYRIVASHLVASPDRVTLFAGNGAVDLRDPKAVVRFDDDDARDAVTARGRRLVVEKAQRFRIDDQRFEAFGYMALGFDGHYPVGWTGHRMAAYWLYTGEQGAGFLSAVDGDYPCGPARKRYGYDDNEPVGVSLAPDLGAVAYRFGHDVLLTSAVPIPWRVAGPLQVADFPRDPSRALLFAQAPGHSGEDDLLGEDARDHAPGIILGPTAAARYAMDLSDTVYRITSIKPWEGTVARVGGPGEGYAVFDAAHREVRRAGGRLLNGWWRWATVLDDGSYWREDLGTGERRRVAEADITPLAAVGVPWTRNVVLILNEGERIWLQLL